MKVVIIFLVICVLTYGAHIQNFRSERSAPDGFDDRIIGGNDASIEDYPYQLSLLRDGSHYCGASIISPTRALTAAHCVNGALPAAISFIAGSNYKNKGGTNHQAAEIIVHKQYNSSTFDYDYAVCRVHQAFDLGKPGVNVINLANDDPSEGSICVVTGWGITLNPVAALLGKLQYVDLPIVEHSTCQDNYKNSNEVTDRMICAGDLEGGKGSCNGDSGGPLVSKVTGRQVGIVSWGTIGCVPPLRPGVYASVANQRAWISENSGV